MPVWILTQNSQLDSQDQRVHDCEFMSVVPGRISDLISCAVSHFRIPYKETQEQKQTNNNVINTFPNVAVLVDVFANLYHFFTSGENMLEVPV